MESPASLPLVVSLPNHERPLILRQAQDERWTAASFLRLSILFGFVALLLYSPALRGPFFWDDEELVYQNPDVVTRGGIVHVWYNTRASEYTPVATASYWFEWGWWQGRTVGYHVDNVLLHALNAALLWLVLSQLEIPGALIAALLFLVHPIAVESVAWIAERRNVLSTAFFLGSLASYLECQRAGNRRWYAAAVALLVFALLTKATVVVMPVLLLLLAWWRNGGVSRRDVTAIAPFAVLALVAGLVRIWFEQHRAMGSIDLQALTWAKRVSNAGVAIWFYIGKMLWPADLTLIYPRLSASPWTAGVAVVAIAVLVAVLIVGRRTWSRGPSIATAYLLVALAPSLGLVNMSYLQHSNVADHFAYLALLSAAALAGAALARLRRLGWALGLTAVLALSAVTVSRAWYFGHPDELWRLTATQNPEAWTAHEHIALSLYHGSNIAAAAEEFRRSLAIHPANYRAWFNLGTMLHLQERFEEAAAAYTRALALQPDLTVARRRLDACRQYRTILGS
jgi:protein O-mannosyl-transferase